MKSIRSAWLFGAAAPGIFLAFEAAAKTPTPAARLTTPHMEERSASQESQLDPRSDGWESEVFAEEIAAQFEILAEQVSHSAERNSHALASAVTANFICGPLRPDLLREVFRDSGIVVRRPVLPPVGPPDDKVEASDAHAGPAGLGKALDSLSEFFLDASNIDVHLKPVDISMTPTSAVTRVIYDARAPAPWGRLQQRATWHCRWVRSVDHPPRLASVRVEDYEEVTRRGRTPFSDCTEAVLGSNPSFSRQMRYGLNHWLERIEHLHKIHIYMRTGLAVGDVNDDGLDDLYVCQPGGLPNRLYIQEPDGTAVDRSDVSGVDILDKTTSALFVDLDNNGTQDLVLAQHGRLVVMGNRGDGRFRVLGKLRLTDYDVHSLSAADYDNDGDLDLYITLDFARPPKGPDGRPQFVYHDANEGGYNRLFRNDIIQTSDGGSPFLDVTAEQGLAENNRRHSLAAAWEDYDEDGDVDLYVANDYGQNCLYRNDVASGRGFTEVASQAGVIDYGSGMSVSWGDYNRDGLMDLYVGNMFSAAGSRTTRQQAFMPAADEKMRALYSRFAKGNSLFKNAGDGTFREVGEEAGVEIARWAWSSLFADVNNDGWDDLLVANGYITTEDTGDL